MMLGQPWEPGGDREGLPTAGLPGTVAGDHGRLIFTVRQIELTGAEFDLDCQMGGG